jgi:hypothetical protein
MDYDLQVKLKISSYFMVHIRFHKFNSANIAKLFKILNDVTLCTSLETTKQNFNVR